MYSSEVLINVRRINNRIVRRTTNFENIGQRKYKVGCRFIFLSCIIQQIYKFYADSTVAVTFLIKPEKLQGINT